MHVKESPVGAVLLLRLPASIYRDDATVPQLSETCWGRLVAGWVVGKSRRSLYTLPMSSIPKALLVLFSLLVWSAPLAAQDPQLFDGHWIFNEGASDSTDKAVEKALKAMGQRVNSKWFSRDKERYRGGPADQELYDR